MSEDSFSVSIELGTAPYQKTLAASLLSRGMLRQVIEIAPYLGVLEPCGAKLEPVRDFPGYTLAKRIVWGIWRRLPDGIRPRPPAFLSAWLADRLLAKRIAPTRIFHGCTAVCLASLGVARKNGAIGLIEHAACHPRQWRDVEREERRRFGAAASGGSADQAERLLRRIDREFEECDYIVVPSAVAQQSFAAYGLGAKTVVVQTAVDSDFYRPRTPAPPSRTFRVCSVGRIEFAKGVGYLLEAWKRLALPNAELLLVGEIKPEIKSFLHRYRECGVRFAGALPAREVARTYHESDLFIMPSPSEGLAQVLLEAMASGLPVVATDRSGANECITNGKEGFIVPARDPDALANALLWCHQHPRETSAAGVAARSRIERQFRLQDYNNRVMNLYRSLAGAGCGERPVRNAADVR